MPMLMKACDATWRMREEKEAENNETHSAQDNFVEALIVMV